MIDDDAVGAAQDGLEQRVRIRDALAAVLAVDEDVDHAAVERPRPVERAGGDDVLEHRRLELLHHLGEAARFQLEDAGGVAARDDLVGLLVVEGQARDVDLLCFGAPAVDQLHRVADHRERLQAEEVELDEPHQLDLVFCELRHQLAVLPAAERHVFPERLLTDDHAGGVHARRAGQPLERARVVDDGLEDGLLLLDLRQLGLVLQRLLDGGRMSVDEIGNVARQLVHLGEGQPHHARHSAP